MNWGVGMEGGGRPGSCSVPKKPKHFLFGPDIHTKHGAELLNVGGTVEDTHSVTQPLAAMTHIWKTSKLGFFSKKQKEGGL